MEQEYRVVKRYKIDEATQKFWKTVILSALANPRSPSNFRISDVLYEVWESGQAKEELLKGKQCLIARLLCAQHYKEINQKHRKIAGGNLDQRMINEETGEITEEYIESVDDDTTEPSAESTVHARSETGEAPATADGETIPLTSNLDASVKPTTLSVSPSAPVSVQAYTVHTESTPVFSPTSVPDSFYDEIQQLSDERK
ncbi:hypothetical protein QFC19_003531 [Naganishia cerealis]|uniref:Uncharacterized protein n=1 Tax=Naganishia cerealis TaxID=610337 RepID=A0ACC2W1C7_9TREE|nr:hypothetical protein QFC19_003531 [Naganishia cerealis]